MSNLKSKFLLGVMIVAVMFVGAFALTASTADAQTACTITATLRVGSSGVQVQCLQMKVGATADGKFGPLTKAAVQAFQAANGLVADGIVGPITRAALMGAPTGNFPPGCTSASGFSPLTGQPCVAGPSSGLPAGCTSTAGYSPITGQKCDSSGGPAQPAGPISASLSSTNPASGTLVEAQALADLAHFTFTGTGTITTLSLERIGISADSTLEDVFLFDGATRLTDSATVSSGSMVTFGGLNLAVNGSRTLSVKADIAASTSGQTVGVKLASVNGSAVAISGNLHTVAAATLAGVAVASATGSVTEPGSDLHVWGGTLTVSTRDVTLNRLALRQVGSIPANEVNNFKLLVDGVQVAATASLDANNYVTFNVSPAKTLTTGSRVLKVMADVVGGSNRTIEFDLRGSYDLGVTDTQFNMGVEATGTFPFGPASSTISAGSMTVVKATNSTSGNITNAANDVVYGAFTFTAYGEAIKVETLTVAFDAANVADDDVTIRNVRVMANGSQVGSTTAVPVVDAHATGTSFTTNFIVTPGSPVTVEVRGDVYDSEGTQELATDDTLQVGLVTGSSNAVRQSSLGSINVPSSLTTGNVLTIKVGTLAMAQTSNYPNQSTISPQTAYKIGSFVLSGNATEAVNVNTFDLDIAVSGTGAIGDVTDVYIKYGANQTSIKSTVVAEGNTWSPSFTLGVNETMTVEVYASFDASLEAADTITASLEVTGTTAQSSSSQGTGVIAGQVITMAAASITASLDASSPVAQLVDDSGSVTTATYKFVSATDSYTITDVNVTVGSASAVSTIHLVDTASGQVLASKPSATDVTFSGLSVPVAANSTKLLSIKLDLSPIGVSMGTTDSSLITTLVVATTLARNSQGTSAAVSGSDAAGNAVYAYKAIPTVGMLALPSSTLTGGVKTIAKFSVSTNGTGTVAWKQILIDINKAAAPTIASPTLWDADTGLQITAEVAFQKGTEGEATTCVADNTFCELLITAGTVAGNDGVQQVSGTKNYEVRATIGGTLADGNFVATSIDRNTAAHVASAAFATNDNAGTANSTSFVWSDESASTTGSTTTATWQKDFLIKDLPLNWTLSR